MAILEVTQLTKSFGDTKVLKGIDFSMERGEILSVIGSSGSGKTTLLRCLTSLETADSGRIVVDGDLVFDGTVARTKTKKSTKDGAGVPIVQFVSSIQCAEKCHATADPRR